MEEKIIRISVRNLVEFILREGDIDNRKAGLPDKEAMQLGGRIHRKIQRQMGSDYHAEVPLKITVPCEGFAIQIEGRADGIQKTADGVVVDEIKGVLRELEYIEKPVGVHLAQAKCYGYIYGKQQELDSITVQMTYCQMETEEVKRFQETFSIEELERWFFDIVMQYEKWARFQIEWRQTRDATIKEAEFPYPYREGQRELVTSVYRTILRKKKLFIQAPTGVGKTMTTIFPAVKAVGEGLGDKIFYLTAKTITRTVAEQAFQILKKNGLQYKVATLTAKEKICFCEKAECNPDVCPYAKGHFDRVNDAVYEMITTMEEMSRENIETQAKKHSVCPFEMGLDVSLWVDAIICDYNYVFDPNAHLKRFFSEGKKGEYLFLIDEAHNLVERGREMYSAVLYKEEFLQMKKAVRYESVKLTRQLEGCNQMLLEMKRECQTYKEYNSISHFALKLLNVMNGLQKLLEEKEQVDEEVLEFYFHVRNFLNIYEEVDENYVIYTELEEGGDFKLKLFCVNPAVKLQNFLSQGNSTVFFSATLLPIRYYKRLLSVETDDYAVYAHSPFKEANRLLVLGQDVSTKYTRRGYEMYERFAIYIKNVMQAKPGNYLVFFPSYRFMEEVRETFERYRTEEMCCMIQEQNMNEQDREAFLQEFEAEREGSLAGFCVMGGIFSEGIDLTKERLIGAMIVGIGLPQVCNEREILKQYFDRHGENGFDYAYLYPGMNKVLQAAGRVIRTEEDKGVIALLDDRFAGRRYLEIFPREWRKLTYCNVKTIGEKVEQFWENAYIEPESDISV
ncbi:ATP-dependent DNA helicase [Coprococcus sp. LG100-32]|jgi:DNA excision repair protein ERCC-2|uniref:ATP-dependent DNA helicase n=1 Tax=Coprococcus sp. LG100-32 TaxID=2997994 RepID=UPI0022E7720B|nr:ATP-dependent DNA helicase [Coprococcus sp. LG100-32]